LGRYNREANSVKQLSLDLAPVDDLEQRRRTIRSQQTILEELATRLDHIIEDYKTQEEDEDGLE